MEASLDIIEPWRSVIGHINIGHLFNMEELHNEAFTLNMMATDEDATQSFLDKALFPTLLGIRDSVITPAVRAYALNQWEYDIQGRFQVETNAKWIKEGEGLYPHNHAGSCISAIIYPQDSKSGLNLFDPRGHACRGYPKAIRDKFFSTAHISPQAGDIYIFPSYMQHSVSYVQEDVRMSILHEYYLRENV
jgi:hypothetical protein